MPAIPESTRSSIIVRLLDHTEKHWPQLAKVQARYHGSFAYITGVLPGGEQVPLFRLRYGGSERPRSAPATGEADSPAAHVAQLCIIGSCSCASSADIWPVLMAYLRKDRGTLQSAPWLTR